CQKDYNMPVARSSGWKFDNLYDWKSFLHALSTIHKIQLFLEELHSLLGINVELEHISRSVPDLTAQLLGLLLHFIVGEFFVVLVGINERGDLQGKWLSVYVAIAHRDTIPLTSQIQAATIAAMMKKKISGPSQFFRLSIGASLQVVCALAESIDHISTIGIGSVGHESAWWAEVEHEQAEADSLWQGVSNVSTYALSVLFQDVESWLRLSRNSTLAHRLSSHLARRDRYLVGHRVPCSSSIPRRMSSEDG